MKTIIQGFPETDSFSAGHLLRSLWRTRSNGIPKPVSLVIVPFKDGEDDMLLAGVREETAL